jgi:hypothetical protein
MTRIPLLMVTFVRQLNGSTFHGKGAMALLPELGVVELEGLWVPLVHVQMMVALPPDLVVDAVKPAEEPIVEQLPAGGPDPARARPRAAKRS